MASNAMPSFEEQLWAELAQEQATMPSPAPVPPTRRDRGPRRRRAVVGIFLVAAALAGVLAPLAGISPWDGSPSFLARAATALTPAPGTVLYESWESTVAPADRNALERPRTVAPDQLWIEAGSPYHYRVVLQPLVDNRSAAAQIAHAARTRGFPSFAQWGGTEYWSGSRKRLQKMSHALEGHALELGGTLQGQDSKFPQAIAQTLTFVPSNELWSAHLFVSFGAPLPGPGAELDSNVADPVGELRAAITEGRAYEAGGVEVEGRTLERIGFNPPAAGTPTRLVDPRYVYAHSYAYVEPKTLRPVEVALNGMYYRILTYETLPATAANLALTSVRAQHPTAAVVPEDPPAIPKPSRIRAQGRSGARP
jgi:hypothetical protein